MNETIVHACPEGTYFCEDCKYGRHNGIWQVPSAYYDKDKEHWTIGNGEYASCVNFCPFCGIDLRTLPLLPSIYATYVCGDCEHTIIEYRFPDKDLDYFCPNHGKPSLTDNGFRMVKANI